MKIAKLFALGLVLFSATGCLLTKVVTVPMRVVGAAVSIVPVAGDKGHDAIDAAADVVDKLPF
jgi:hypothetical protein